ncbi:uncharacterized protein LOC117781585 [Drosophila innubila]|uniref:uncharacterized protein LOC117781585 n=1 Tax=Drosophila innubila TaxID=198719 RepID=UPI00148DE916|nr:uncharacterized protein LOC117781585 [Drosophila innubila]
MRSRTELVTTTFDLDSDEEDYSPDDDDSEEDWRPNKKRQQKQSRANGNSSNETGGRKRRSTGSAASKAGKRRALATKVSDDDFESAEDDDDDDDDLDTEHSDEDIEFPAASTSSKRLQSLPTKKQFVKLAQLDLLINKRELSTKDWLQNSRLCLWRKDEQTNLLQKYLRVKTSLDTDKPGEQQLLFTSSSVYSSWDEQDIGDFVDVKVNCLDPNNRRIQLTDIEAIKKLSIELQAEQKQDPTDNIESPKILKDEEENDNEQVGA